MFTINKLTSASAVDYAAEELRKYLRMMMPHSGRVIINYAPEAKSGFRLGLMQELGLDVSDAEDTELDDIIYIDTDREGGIIAGDNPRSVLLAVYEFFRQNGCRWFMPGADGEYIPMKDIEPVKYRHKPSCRYRGECNEGAEIQDNMLAVIDFLPKVGMNVFMMEHFIPQYYRFYYSHNRNASRKPEPVSDDQILQWKRECEAEMEKRGLQFHDIGHGFTSYPFGYEHLGKGVDYDEAFKDRTENYKYLALYKGERKIHLDSPFNTNFCMSNPEARDKVSDFVRDYAKDHPSDYLHVWLADGVNNHCECEECKKKTPSDWYVILLNEIDGKLTEAGLDTRIVFIAYVDTIWAPLSERIDNPSRFTMLFAPIHRSYATSLVERDDIKVRPYERNNNEFPRDLAESFAYFREWKRMWEGSSVAYEYHFWAHQTYDLSGLHIARLIYDDVRVYKKQGINGIIEDGSQRSFFPNGFPFYVYARTLYDTEVSYEELLEDYFGHVYGEDWRDFVDYLTKLRDLVPYTYISRGEARYRKDVYKDAEMVLRLEEAKRLVDGEGRALIEKHYNSDIRIRTLSVRLLEHHADFCILVLDWLGAKARGEDALATELYNKASAEFGRREAEIATYFDHFNFFSTYYHVDTQIYYPIGS